MSVQTRVRPNGMVIRRFSGTDTVAWWCKTCDGKRPTHRYQRRAPSIVDAEAAFARHEACVDHRAATDRQVASGT